MKAEAKDDFRDLTEEDEANLQVSSNPASFNSLPLTIKELFRAYGIRTETVMPAEIVSYDRKAHVADVQLLVKKVYDTTQGNRYKDREVVTVPVMRMQHGLFWSDAPLYPGDTGYVVAGHRDASLAVEGNSALAKPPKLEKNALVPVTENKGPQPPNTYLLHRYENGFFVPCRWGDVTIPKGDEDAMVIAARLKPGAERKDDPNRVTDAAELVEQVPLSEPPLFETLGTEGKVTMKGDGTVHVVNRSGLVVERDLYREALPDEAVPDKVTSDGLRLMRVKPKAVIDPTDLGATDARFREIVAMEPGVDEATGKVTCFFRKYRVLADVGEVVKELEMPSHEAVDHTVYDKDTHELYNVVGKLMVVDGRLVVGETRKQPITTAVQETVAQ